MLDGETAQVGHHRLDRLNSKAVVGSRSEVVVACCFVEIEVQAEIDAEPLAISPFMLEHPHVSPNPQVGDVYGVVHSGRSRWLN